MCISEIQNIYIYISTKILEVNLFAFAYRLFRRDFSPLDGTYCMGTHCFVEISPHSTGHIAWVLNEYPCNMPRRVGRNLY